MKKMSCSWKGCLFGCLGVILFGIICSISLSLWLTSKSEFEAHRTILQPNSEIYARMYVRAEDTMLVDFLMGQIEEINRDNPGANWAPEALKGWNNRKQRKDIEKLLPMEIEVMGMVTEDQLAASVGFSIYGNALKIIYWLFKRDASKNGRLHHYRDSSYVEVVDDGQSMFFLSLQQSIVYLADSKKSMELMLDGGAGEAEVAEADSRLAGLDLESQAYGFIAGFGDSEESRDQAREKMTFLFDDLSTNEEAMYLFDRISRIAYQIKVSDVETLSGLILLDTQDHSDKLKETIKTLMSQATENAQLEVEWTVSEVERGFQVDFTLNNFAEAAGGNRRIIIAQ